MSCTSPLTSSRCPSGLGKYLDHQGCTNQYIPLYGSVHLQCPEMFCNRFVLLCLATHETLKIGGEVRQPCCWNLDPEEANKKGVCYQTEFGSANCRKSFWLYRLDKSDKRQIWKLVRFFCIQQKVLSAQLSIICSTFLCVLLNQGFEFTSSNYCGD